MNPLLGVIQLEMWRIEPEWSSIESKKSKTEMAIDESPIHESKKMLGVHRVKSVLLTDMDTSSYA